ncbi:MAG: hypothetical protein QOK25_1818 [Thermoleophilaceae bacterium]|jgi:hypothetical protein|nr:hypothetical protein [Thermoleophilaceae bacterium]
MHQLTSTTGIVALAAGGVAVLALILALALALRMRRVRQAQTAVLGPGGERDLVAHAERLETGFTDLREWVEETMERIGQRMDVTEGRLDGCVAHTALVRYDAYNELSGHQSSSIALLDSRRSGVVLTSIVHRDQARLYVKQVRDGEGEIALSPEEQEAVDTALAPLRDAA